jgi:hypothetical protein
MADQTANTDQSARARRALIGFALLLLLTAAPGCAAARTSRDGPAQVPPDQIHPVVRAAGDKVQVMTWPTVETALCFPQMPVWVRRTDGVVNTGDVSLYGNRRMDEAYHRVVFLDKGRVGYCTPSGEVVIPPRFDAGERFQEGIAVVQAGGKHGYIDQFGEWLIPPRFEFAYGFWYGLGAAKQGGRYGLVDHRGEWVKPPEFVYMAAVGGGITARSANGEEGFVDARGEFIKTGPLAKFYRPPGRGH